MSEETKLTGVEWLFNQLPSKLKHHLKKELELAKRVEKTNNWNTWNNAINVGEKDKWESFEQYYEHTYGEK